MPATTRPSISVILPAYNEEALIGETLDEVHTYLRAMSDRCDWEIVVVDDGSADATSNVVERFADDHDHVRLLRHASNFNVGQALRYAFSTCTTDYLVTLDSDLSYAPEHIGLLLDTIEDTRARIVIASPYLRGGRLTNVPRFRAAASRNANRILSWAAPGKLHTLTGMVRAYDRRFMSGLDLKSMDVAINTEIIYKAQLVGAKIVEVPAHLDWTRQMDASVDRSSSIRITRSVLAYTLSAFIFRPIMFFALPGLLALVLSVYTLAWALYRVIENYPATAGSLDSRISSAIAGAFAAAPHTFVVGGISFIIAVQLLSLAILSTQKKRYFEELFHLGTTILRQDVDLARHDGAMARSRPAHDAPANGNGHTEWRTTAGAPGNNA